MTDPSGTDVLGAALAAYDAGMSVIPIRSDGSKKPPFSWKQYQTTRATRAEVRAWFAPGRYEAAAVICGAISGGLQMLEMEGWAYNQHRWEHLRAACIDALGDFRWAQITRYVELSPSSGPHLFMRCPEVGYGNLKLARGMPAPGDKPVEMIETRGEGGYVVIAGSVGHASGKAWRVATEGTTMDDIATVTAEELDIIYDAARSLDEAPIPEPLPPATVSSHDETRRGEGWIDAVIDEFNASTDVRSFLTGWTEVGIEAWNGERVVRLHREGSANDHGAVILESGRVGFFSSNCPPGCEPYDGRKLTTYDAFTMMVITQWGSDANHARVDAARKLRDAGYGPQPASGTGPAGNSPAPDGATLDGSTDTLPLAVRWVEDAISDPPPEPEVLVTNLLRRGEVTVLGAPRAIGKTWASFNLTALAARGSGHLFGSPLFRVTKPSKVLYFQGELGEWGSAVRWELQQGRIPPQTVAETFERVRVRTTTRKVVGGAEGETWTDEHTIAVVDARIEETIVAVGADIVVIDPWATFFAGKENSNDETEAAILALIDIARRTNAAIWIVHHISAKTQHSTLAEPEDLWRGASRLADAVATRVTVLPHYTPTQAKERGMDRIDARRFVDIHVLERNGPPVGLQHAKREGFWWEAWEGEGASVDGGRPPAITAKALCLALERNGGEVASKTELADLCKVSRRGVDRVLADLLASGAVAEVDKGGNRTGYRLTDLVP
jgi:hypothetical protein